MAAVLCLLMTGGTALAANETLNSQTLGQVQAVAGATKAKAASAVKAVYSLDLDTTKYEKKMMTVDGKKVAFRAYENRVYVAHPVDTTYQAMNIYVPEGYFKGKSINGYTAKTAPIFLPNTVGGYMPGEPGQPSEQDRMTGGANAILVALSKGYVVAAPGARGRTNQGTDGSYTGKAPALIVDMKLPSAICAIIPVVYRATRKRLSPTGRVPAVPCPLIGATGNSADYENYLKALGAADERDDIYASSVYCPITDLDHADMAYEWMFNGVNTYHQGKGRHDAPAMMESGANEGTGMPGGAPPTVGNRPDNAPMEAATGTVMTEAQQQVSRDLKAAYPAYINGLHLVDTNGTALTLDENGHGTFETYIKSIYMASAQKALDSGIDLSSKSWLTIQDGKVVDMDLAGYARDVNRLKAARPSMP